MLPGLFSLLLFVFAATSRAETGTPAAFDAANRLYEQGKFSDAAAAYEKLAQSPHCSAAVYFNLGNAWFKSGQIGRAIAAYRKAAEISPRDPDLRANTKFARDQTQGPTVKSSAWQSWLGKLTLNEWTWLSAAAVWLFFLLLVVRQWRPSLRPGIRSFIFASGLAAVFLCVCLALAWEQRKQGSAAIVVTRDAPVRQTPFEEAPTTFTVHDGAELLVLDHKDDWLQVTTDARRVGWVRRDQVLLAP